MWPCLHYVRRSNLKGQPHFHCNASVPCNINPSREWRFSNTLFQPEKIPNALLLLFPHSYFKFKGILELNSSKEADFCLFVCLFLFPAMIWDTIHQNEDIIRILPRQSPSTFSSPGNRGLNLFFSFYLAGTFVFQIKSLDFLPKLSSLLCVSICSYRKTLLVGIDEKTISIDMDMSTKTNVTEVIEISVSWKTMGRRSGHYYELSLYVLNSY